MSNDTMKKWAAQKEKGDLLNGKGLWKPDGRIENGVLFSDNIMAKSYVDTSLKNFGKTDISFQKSGMKHREFASGDGVVGTTIASTGDKIHCW